MSHEEKAKELIKRFKYWGDATIQSSRGGKYSPGKEIESATKCAIICVEEILEVVISAYHKLGCGEIGDLEDYIEYIYWNKVLEILKAK